MSNVPTDQSHSDNPSMGDYVKGGDGITRHPEDMLDAEIHVNPTQETPANRQPTSDRIRGKTDRDQIRNREAELKSNLNRAQCEMLANRALTSSYRRFTQPNRRADIAVTAGLCYELALHCSKVVVLEPLCRSSSWTDKTTINVITYKLLEYAPFRQPLELVFENVPSLVEILLHTRRVLQPAEPAESVRFVDLVSLNCARYAGIRLRRCVAGKESALYALRNSLESSEELDGDVAELMRDNRQIWEQILKDLAPKV